MAGLALDGRQIRNVFDSTVMSFFLLALPMKKRISIKDAWSLDMQPGSGNASHESGPSLLF